MNDAFSLASTGDLDFAVALETMNFLQKERGAYVWQSAIQIITKLYTSLGPTEAYPLFEVRNSPYGESQTLCCDSPHVHSHKSVFEVRSFHCWLKLPLR